MTTLRDLEDRELVRKWTEDRNERAFTTLVNRYRPKVLAYFTKSLQDRDQAEDLTQELFIRVWSSLDDYEDINFPGWLHVLSRNILIDHHRAKKNDPVIPFCMIADDDGVPIESVEFLTPELNLEATELSRIILEKLGELPDKIREVMLARYQDGHLIKEIAEMFDAPEGTVKTWLYRGRMDLREKLDLWLT